MLLRLIYQSSCVRASSHEWKSILASAQANNPRLGITGALFCDGKSYLQVLEGPGHQVEALYEKIARDTRHSDLTLLSSEIVESRWLSEWSMGFLGIDQIMQILRQHDVSLGISDDHIRAIATVLLSKRQSLGLGVKPRIDPDHMM